MAYSLYCCVMSSPRPAADARRWRSIIPVVACSALCVAAVGIISRKPRVPKVPHKP